MREPLEDRSRLTDMMLVRLIRTALATVATAAAMVALPTAPAFACSCSSGDTRDFVDWADLVVVGTVTDQDGGGLFGSDGTVTYTVEVERAYGAATTSAVAVESADSGSACGLEGIEVGTRYVVFAHLEDGRYAASLCGGTAPASDRLVGQVEDLLGAGQPPGPGGPAVPGGGWRWLFGWVDLLLRSFG